MEISVRGRAGRAGAVDGPVVAAESAWAAAHIPGAGAMIRCCAG